LHCVEACGINHRVASQANQREAVRLLAIEFGVREAARKCGLNEDRVRQWSSRYNWLQAQAPDQKKTTLTTVTKAGDIMLEELHEHERETKLSLARYARRAAKDSETAYLKDSPYVHKVGQVAGLVHKWGDEKPNQQFTLNVLNLNVIEDSQGQGTE